MKLIAIPPAIALSGLVISITSAQAATCMSNAECCAQLRSNGTISTQRCKPNGTTSTTTSCPDYFRVKPGETECTASAPKPTEIQQDTKGYYYPKYPTGTCNPTTTTINCTTIVTDTSLPVCPSTPN